MSLILANCYWENTARFVCKGAIETTLPAFAEAGAVMAMAEKAFGTIRTLGPTISVGGRGVAPCFPMADSSLGDSFDEDVDIRDALAHLGCLYSDRSDWPWFRPEWSHHLEEMAIHEAASGFISPYKLRVTGAQYRAFTSTGAVALTTWREQEASVMRSFHNRPGDQSLGGVTLESCLFPYGRFDLPSTAGITTERPDVLALAITRERDLVPELSSAAYAEIESSSATLSGLAVQASGILSDELIGAAQKAWDILGGRSGSSLINLGLSPITLTPEGQALDISLPRYGPAEASLVGPYIYLSLTGGSILWSEFRSQVQRQFGLSNDSVVAGVLIGMILRARIEIEAISGPLSCDHSVARSHVITWLRHAENVLIWSIANGI